MKRIFVLILIIGFSISIFAKNENYSDLKIFSVKLKRDFENTPEKFFYNPSEGRKIPIQIGISFKGECTVGELSITLRARSKVYIIQMPITVQKPASKNFLIKNLRLKIPKGLPYGKYKYEIKVKPKYCDDKRSINNYFNEEIELLKINSNSDFWLNKILFSDGRPVGEGCLYAKGFATKCKFKVLVGWNRKRVPGTSCNINLVLRPILSGRGTSLPMPPAPIIFTQNDFGNGNYAYKEFYITIPRNYEGNEIRFKAIIMPKHKECDYKSSNNSIIFTLPMHQKRGDDLAIKIYKVEREFDYLNKIWEPRVSIIVANVSGDRVLRNVVVSIKTESCPTPKTVFHKIKELPPRRWVKFVKNIDGSQILPGMVIKVKIDPNNVVSEADEKNNEDMYMVR